MATLPSPSQVAGNNTHLYENYFLSLEKEGTIPALEAATFLKKSGLSDFILSKIWDLSDPSGKGYLNKAGFYAALKLVSLAQIGQDVSINNLLLDAPPPKLAGQVPSRGPTPTIPPTINSVPAMLNDWAMKPTERAKYEQLFESLQPLNGVIPGNKVKGLLIDSKLPVATLGRIWDLADMDKDGSLDKHEFIVAMHLVYKALEKYAIPNSLPPELLPPDKRKDSVHAAMTIQVQPSQPSAYTGGPVWVVTPDERAKYDNLFIQSDVDKDGYVSGLEIKDIFLQSGVPQASLANIWGLCDIKQSGKLNSEQFALAMWMIHQKLKGIDPPLALTPEMIPPSMRTQVNGNTTAATATASHYSNPELDMISKDIEELVREQMILENDILQKDAELKVKTGEAKSLQGELDTLAATLKQLDNQKGEAGRRLNDLKNQVEKLKADAEEQEVLVTTQEEELSSKKRELETLKEEETRLQSEQSDLNKKLNSLSECLQESQLTISQAKTKIEDILDHQRQLKEAIEILETALGANDSSVSNRYLEIDPEYRDPSYTRLINPTNETDEIPKNKVSNTVISTAKSDSFSSAFKQDPFASNSFGSAFGDPQPKSAFGNDPFGSFSTGAVKSDPFDAFGSNATQRANKPTSNDFDDDPFGCEPFGAPAPALPPKNKQPPPRPAPPRPAPPSVPASATAPAAAANDGFADFSAFNSKGTSLDFTEDPFKDYRYEDTFNIEDPFEEDATNDTKPNIDAIEPDLDNFTGKDPFAPIGSKNLNIKPFSLDRKSKAAIKTEELEPAWFAFEDSNRNENKDKNSNLFS